MNKTRELFLNDCEFRSVSLLKTIQMLVLNIMMKPGKRDTCDISLPIILQHKLYKTLFLLRKTPIACLIDIMQYSQVTRLTLAFPKVNLAIVD